MDIQSSSSSPLRIALLGCTGSIGDSVVRLVRANPEKLKLESIVGGRNHLRLLELVREFSPSIVGLESVPSGLFEQLKGEVGLSGGSFISGPSVAVKCLREAQVDVVIGAITGIAGLPSSLEALDQGLCLLLANKESLVCAGELMVRSASENQGRIISIDSEHSALAQLLEGQLKSNSGRGVVELTLTASGGPFLNRTRDSLASVTPAEAVRHPKWDMGAKISVDSSTMVNKALEVAEAYWLFGYPVSNLNVIVHPQSIVHALITFSDGVQLAQLSNPDMIGPISFGIAQAMGAPRFDSVLPSLSLAQVGKLEFMELDNDRFPVVNLIKSCLERGGALPAVFNGANEFAVQAFLSGQLSYLQITNCIETVVEHFDGRTYSDLDDLLELHQEVNECAERFQRRFGER